MVSFVCTPPEQAYQVKSVSSLETQKIPVKMHALTHHSEDSRLSLCVRSPHSTVLELLKADIKPRDIMTRAAFENSMTIVMALGGSTNAVLHLLAMARACGVPLTLDDFQACSDRTPFIADLKPSGKYVMEDVHKVGLIPDAYPLKWGSYFTCTLYTVHIDTLCIEQCRVGHVHNSLQGVMQSGASTTGVHSSARSNADRPMLGTTLYSALL
jgi:hypothetical protein